MAKSGKAVLPCEGPTYVAVRPITAHRHLEPGETWDGDAAHIEALVACGALRRADAPEAPEEDALVRFATSAVTPPERIALGDMPPAPRPTRQTPEEQEAQRAEQIPHASAHDLPEDDA